MKHSTVVAVALALALPACKSPNPKSDPSEAQQLALKEAAQSDLDAARVELAGLRVSIEELAEGAQRSELEAHAQRLDDSLAGAARRIDAYAKQGDAEGVDGVLDSDVADAREEIARLREQLAGDAT